MTNLDLNLDPKVSHNFPLTSVCVLQVFPNKSLRKLKECISIRDRLLSHKLEEHKVTMVITHIIMNFCLWECFPYFDVCMM